MFLEIRGLYGCERETDENRGNVMKKQSDNRKLYWQSDKKIK